VIGVLEDAFGVGIKTMEGEEETGAVIGGVIGAVGVGFTGVTIGVVDNGIETGEVETGEADIGVTGGVITGAIEMTGCAMGVVVGGVIGVIGGVAGAGFSVCAESIFRYASSTSDASQPWSINIFVIASFDTPIFV